MRLGGGIGAHNHLLSEITEGPDLVRQIARSSTVIAPVSGGRSEVLVVPVGVLLGQHRAMLLRIWGTSLAGNEKNFQVNLGFTGGADIIASEVGHVAAGFRWYGEHYIARGSANGRAYTSSWFFDQAPARGGSWTRTDSFIDTLFAGLDWDTSTLSFYLLDTLGAGQLNTRARVLHYMG